MATGVVGKKVRPHLDSGSDYKAAGVQGNKVMIHHFYDHRILHWNVLLHNSDNSDHNSDNSDHNSLDP